MSKAIEDQAAAWVLRCDRGLSPAEQDEMSQWLAADAQHGKALRRFSAHWTRLDKTGQWLPEHSPQPNPDLLAPPLRKRMIRLVPALLSIAAALVIGLGLLKWNQVSHSASTPARAYIGTASDSAHRELEDGSVIELNNSTAVTVDYTKGERRVRLEHGEAHFTVAKNPYRPFIVSANGVGVCAVGTAFNVRMDTAAVEVLVTEGRVQLKIDPSGATRASPTDERAPVKYTIPVLDAKQRAVISLAQLSEPPQIATLTTGEIERVLDWQHRLLDFTGAPLSEIVAEFNRRNHVQLVLVDSELSSLRVSASFRSDNIEGFVRLLETGFGVHPERRGNDEIRLHKTP